MPPHMAAIAPDAIAAIIFISITLLRGPVKVRVTAWPSGLAGKAEEVKLPWYLRSIGIDLPSPCKVATASMENVPDKTSLFNVPLNFTLALQGMDLPSSEIVNEISCSATALLLANLIMILLTAGPTKILANCSGLSISQVPEPPTTCPLVSISQASVENE